MSIAVLDNTFSILEVRIQVREVTAQQCDVERVESHAITARVRVAPYGMKSAQEQVDVCRATREKGKVCG